MLDKEDFIIVEDGIFLPVNIKMELKQSDKNIIMEVLSQIDDAVSINTQQEEHNQSYEYSFSSSGILPELSPNTIITLEGKQYFYMRITVCV